MGEQALYQWTVLIQEYPILKDGRIEGVKTLYKVA